MYKKLHTPEKEPSAEPFCDKGSFLWCVPERGIMLTNFVYHIQHKKRKNSCRWSGVFSVTYQGIKSDT
ncbi:hypothetical protein CHH47_29035 [Priestia megaterium]|nr:hypothetical protein CHH47_29035 [Priestia megaterium]